LKYIFVLLLTLTALFSAQITQPKWKAGEVFSTYLERNGISQSLLKSIHSDDLQYLSEIQAGEVFYELRRGGKLLQTLIPLGEEMQIHLFRDTKLEKFHFDIIPVIYQELSDDVSFDITKSFYLDMKDNTKNPRLGYLLKKYYAKTVDFRKLRKNDKISFIYKQKSRLGKPYGSAKIEASLIKTQGKYKFIYADKDGVFYDNINKRVAYIVKKNIKIDSGRTFVRPVKKMRITSKFTYKRWHPILRRYRPHLGVDIGAKRGTKIYATHSGKVIYAGWMGGYGKVVKISHVGGYVSLYAHQSRIGVKKGQYVKRNQVIGYIGNTGRSTGPHLHFGLYKHKKAVNPMNYIEKKSIGKKKIKVQKIRRYKVVEIKNAKANKRKLLKLIKGEQMAHKWESFDRAYDMINDRSKHEK